MSRLEDLLFTLALSCEVESAGVSAIALATWCGLFEVGDIAVGLLGCEEGLPGRSAIVVEAWRGAFEVVEMLVKGVNVLLHEDGVEGRENCE